MLAASSARLARAAASQRVEHVILGHIGVTFRLRDIKLVALAVDAVLQLSAFAAAPPSSIPTGKSVVRPARTRARRSCLRRRPVFALSQQHGRISSVINYQ
jgi:hypothetical protein